MPMYLVIYPQVATAEGEWGAAQMVWGTHATAADAVAAAAASLRADSGASLWAVDGTTFTVGTTETTHTYGVTVT
jgi:hypothetical protein